MIVSFGYLTITQFQNLVQMFERQITTYFLSHTLASSTFKHTIFYYFKNTHTRLFWYNRKIHQIFTSNILEKELLKHSSDVPNVFHLLAHNIFCDAPFSRHPLCVSKSPFVKNECTNHYSFHIVHIYHKYALRTSNSSAVYVGSSSVSFMSHYYTY